MASETPLRFGRFEICPAERALRVDGTATAIGARAFDLLLALAQRRERLVTRQELLDIVWPGVVVEEHNITAQMSTLRRLLGAKVIATVPGRGYQFVATLDAAPLPAGPAGRVVREPTLPESRTRFIGRDAALADLGRLVPQSRLTTLVGIGGSGKTRLALQWARVRRDMFAGGVCFVDLAPLQSTQRVAPACAAALGLSDQREPELIDRIAAHLAGREALLVLDNCEHVRAGAAAIADALLARAGVGRIVATSREALGVPGEQLYPVRALSLPATSELAEVQGSDAVRLFIDRARLGVPEFELTGANAAAVAELCRRLDGIALAIELAAARVALLPVAEITARLADRFVLLGGSAAGDPRQRTLLATIQWSHDQLAPAAQRLLRQVAVFAGGWTLPAATALANCADEYETLALLTALHEHSLLVVERDEHGGRPRYRILETVRQYAGQRLEQCGEADAARARHAEHFLALAEAVAPQLRGPRQPQAMAQLREERENLVAAIGWCVGEASPADPQWALRFVAATTRYWVFNELSLGCDLAAAALRHDTEGTDTAARFHTLHALAQMHMHAGDPPPALAYGREALALAQRRSNADWQMRALGALGSASSVAGDETAALSYHHEALALAETADDAVHVAMVSNNIGEIERGHGRWDSAEHAYRRALHLLRIEGDALVLLIVLHNLVRLMVAAGRHDEARAFAHEAETRVRGLAESVLKLELLKVSAGIAAGLGEHALAARWWGAASARFAEAGYSDPRIDVLQMTEQQAAARRALGDAAFDAAEAAGRALALDDTMHELRQWLAASRPA